MKTMNEEKQECIFFHHCNTGVQLISGYSNRKENISESKKTTKNCKYWDSYSSGGIFQGVRLL